ncbi:MAG: excinuclease ABC subunit UvrC [Hyphomonadaceae bacterium]|nr:excinuclease ABC subunit UvrC [Hyphomonadaceae bacterium]
MARADKPSLPPLQDLPAQDPPSATGAASGAEVIRDYLPRLPARPGVYRMLAADGEVLYVGKAKSLKNRVSQYAQGRAHANRLHRMVALTAAMEFVVTATETEALLLEANMIKRLRPRFNVLLRDDKSFPCIAIRENHPAPAIQKHRGARSFQGRFFGPFASANAVNRTLSTLQKAFLLRSCSDSVLESRTRPCMLYQIKRCSAPCVDLIARADYLRLVNDAADFLNGQSVALQERLAADMTAAADSLNFEKAARLRDRIRALAAIRSVQGVNPQSFTEADVFALHCEAGQSCIQVFFFRAGQNWGNKAYFPRHEKEAEPEEILAAFLAQFYDERDPPGLILVSHEPVDSALLEQALAMRAGRALEVRRPQRGEKREIMAQAVLNAREALGRRLAESASLAKILEGVAETFDLPGPPERIEVYDNSHIQGASAIGAMIVAGPDGFQKSQYRKFNIKGADLAPGDDYGMMREVLRRRFARLLKEHAPREPAGESGGVDFSQVEQEEKLTSWPDLVLIDGGEGQLKAARETLQALGCAEQVRLVGIAKGVDRDAGRERFFMDGRPAFRLDEKSPTLYYLQRLRDEAHRFAIGAHRQKRKAELIRNPLDEIAGVGPARKKALLHRFGSARGVARAAVAELALVEGVNEALARRIHEHFHERG